MDIIELIKTLKGFLPSSVRVKADVEDLESEPVGWDFYGNVTEVEYTSTPLIDEVRLYLYWDEPEGVVGVETKIPNSVLDTMSVENVETLARMITSTIEHRR